MNGHAHGLNGGSNSHYPCYQESALTNQPKCLLTQMTEGAFPSEAHSTYKKCSLLPLNALHRFVQPSRVVASNQSKTEAHRETSTQTDRDTSTQTDRETSTQAHREISIETDRETSTQADRDTFTEADRDKLTQEHRDTSTQADIDT